jgi:putative Mg2+ transporter-C (MgtC) family protein
MDVGVSMVLHMGAALLLGWTIGYERYFSGRAAGSQVYCLVCATSCAITLLAGFPARWYGGGSSDVGGDPTRVIGAILTGIGFLGAGIIVQTGLNVRGLTTAASIWGSAAIGILVGAGFYVPAIGLAALFVVSMAVVPRLERRLPARSAIAAKVCFREGYRPQPEEIHGYLAERGLQIPVESLSISHCGGRFELECLIFGGAVTHTDAMGRVAFELAEMANVDSFTVTHSSRT